LPQQGFDRAQRLLSLFQLLVVGNHNAISMMPRTVPSRVVCKHSRTLFKIVAAPDSVIQKISAPNPFELFNLPD
jgi:hypothetical protein